MRRHTADKIIALAVTVMLVALATPACNDGRTAQRSNLNNSGSTFDGRSDASDNRPTGERDDFGEDWDAEAQTRQDRGTGRRSIRTLGRGRGADRDDSPTRDGRQRAGRSEPFWTIVLGTFSGSNHEQAAQNMLGELQRVAPELTRGARSHTTSRGSMVIYGQYPEAEDRQARRDLERVKEIRYREMPIFAKAFLSRITPSSAKGAHPHALLSVREEYPNVDPLYTLQVAAWGDFDSGTMTMDQIRRQAEDHVRRLRAQGHEAYFHHDPGQQLSIVTVGLFDRRAFDSETGERSPELQMLKRQFPAHLVNGEELHEPIDRQRPDRGTRVQPPHLVLVPMP